MSDTDALFKKIMEPLGAEIEQEFAEEADEAIVLAQTFLLAGRALSGSKARVIVLALAGALHMCSTKWPELTRHVVEEALPVVHDRLHDRLEKL